LKTVRQKLVKAEKDREEAVKEHSDLKSDREALKIEIGLSRAEAEKARGEAKAEVERLRLEKDKEVANAKAQLEKEFAAAKEKIEKEMSARRAQYELDAITTKVG
jgi:hypothetical protein